jgi:lambda family phage tail tape measure protein
MDVKTIGIEVQQKGVVATTNSLARLTTAAQNLVKPVQGAVDALAELDGINLKPVADQFKTVSQGVKDTNTALSGITASSSGIKALSNQFTSIATAAERMGTAVPGLSQFAEQLERIKNTLEGMKGMGAALTSVRRAAEQTIPSNSGGSSARGATTSTDDLTKSQQQLLKQMERNAMMIDGKTKAGYFELRAAQEGITSSAAPFIAKMREAEKGLNNTGLSAKQTAFAMKMVPAQMTDIVTQLAGGQSPLLVMIQQGGQLRDMFQGFGNMFKNVGAMILKWLMNPWVLATAAIAAFGYAAYKMVTQFDAVNQAFVLTNNYTGLTAAQFSDMTKQVGTATGSFSGAKDAMLGLVSSGVRAGDNFSQMATAVTNFSRYTGTATEDTVKWYAQIQKTPLDTLRQFDDQYHNITASTLELVSAHQKSGDALGAVKIAIDAVIAAQSKMASEAQEKAGIFTKAMRAVADSFNKVFSGGPKLDTSTKIDEQIAKQKQLYAQQSKSNPLQAADTADYIKQLEAQKKVLSTTEKSAAIEQEKKNTFRDQQDFLKQIDRTAETASGKQMERIRATERIATLETQITKLKSLQGTMSASEYTKRSTALNAELADAKKKQEPDKVKGAGSGTSAIASAMAELQKQRQLNQQLTSGTYVSTEKMTEDQKKLLELENVITLSKQKGSNVTKEQVALASKLIPIYREAAPLSAQNQKLEADQKALDTLKKKTEEAKLNTEALKEQVTYLEKSGKTTDNRSNADKLSAKFQSQANTAKSEGVRLAAQAAADATTEEATWEKILKKVLEVNKAKEATLKMQTDYRLEVQAAEEAEANSQAWMHLSSVEQEKRNSLQSIEVTRRKEIADLEDKISQAYAEGNVGLAEQLRLQEQSVNARAAGLSKVATNKPTLQSKEGSSILSDAEAGYVNFYNGLESRTQLMQTMFSTAFSTMSDSLATFCNTGKLDFKAFTVSILKGIQEMILKFMLLKLAQMAAGVFMSGASSAGTGSGIGSGAGGMTGTISTPGLVYGSASGNVFGSMTNQVYSKTTPFKFASGGTFGKQGVLGEAGPEAVVPLARTPSGKLGIQTTGGSASSGGNNFQINVTVESNGQSSVSSSSDSEDAKRIGEGLTARIKAVIVEELRPNGVLAKA